MLRAIERCLDGLGIDPAKSNQLSEQNQILIVEMKLRLIGNRAEVEHGVVFIDVMDGLEPASSSFEAVALTQIYQLAHPVLLWLGSVLEFFEDLHKDIAALGVVETIAADHVSSEQQLQIGLSEFLKVKGVSEAVAELGGAGELSPNRCRHAQNENALVVFNVLLNAVHRVVVMVIGIKNPLGIGDDEDPVLCRRAIPEAVLQRPGCLAS